MILQQAKYKGTCLLTSFAMAIGVNQQALVRDVGHPGNKIFWPELKTPYSRIGHHPQELIDALFKRGYSVTPIEQTPVSGQKDSKDLYFIPVDPDRFKNYLTRNNSVVITDTHACACDGRIIYDPVGKLLGIEAMMPHIKLMYLVNQINTKPCECCRI